MFPHIYNKSCVNDSFKIPCSNKEILVVWIQTAKGWILMRFKLKGFVHLFGVFKRIVCPWGCLNAKQRREGTMSLWAFRRWWFRCCLTLQQSAFSGKGTPVPLWGDEDSTCRGYESWLSCMFKQLSVQFCSIHFSKGTRQSPSQSLSAAIKSNWTTFTQTGAPPSTVVRGSRSVTWVRTHILW